jgi:thiamine-phosphate pyrophosphorylase
MMTDPRMGDPIAMLRRMRQRIGVIVRHYDLPAKERRQLLRRVQCAASGKHLVIFAARPATAHALGAAGAHDRSAKRSKGVRTMAVHSRREAALARRMKADLILVSPLFPTRSHRGAQSIGVLRAVTISGSMRHQTLALGGMNAKRFTRMSAAGFYGWAGIDAFSRQNLTAVPI